MAIGFDFGKYRIIAELGHGGMADVFLAMVCGPSGSGFLKLAVVKRLRRNLVEDPEFVTMLIDEARITARLNHPNVVQTLEVGIVDDEYFLAMEYLEGQPLHRIQKRGVRLGTPLDKSLEYLVIYDALAGLHHAHELSDYDGSSLGIVHRDITPQNLLVTYDGQTKVVDFGIAKAAGRASETKHGIVKGKVRYMSPEQAMGQQIDRRADIFAIGILLWEAATGLRFWRDEDDLSIVQMLVGGDYNPSPKAAVSDVPDAIDTICRRALAHRADERYAFAAELQADLEAVLGAELVDARRRLGPKVVELFAKERGQLRAIVQQAGCESGSAVSMQVLAAAPDSSTAMSLQDPDSAGSLAPFTRKPTPFPVRFRSASTPPPSSFDANGPILPDNIPTLVPPDLDRGDHDDHDHLLGFIPWKKRFGAGLLFGAGTMLVAVLVAILAVTAVIVPSSSDERGGGGARVAADGSIDAAAAAAAAVAKVPRAVEEHRIGIERSNVTTRSVRSEAMATPSVAHVSPWVPAAPRAVPALTPAPATSTANAGNDSANTSSAPAVSGPSGHGNSHEAPSRKVRAVDMSDPWGRMH